MSRLFGRRRSERGAVLVIATVGVALAMVATALAVDTGRVGQERRRDQKVADLAALDAVRNTANAQALAVASAARNGFTVDAAHTLVAEVGSVNASNVFSPGLGTSAVRVTVASPFENAFQPGERTVTARAVATQQAVAGFSLGSSLVTLDTSRSTLLNNFIGGMIGSPGLSLALASWQGLASGSLTLSALRTQLANLGFSVGTTTQLLNTNVTLAQLFLAAANALTASGDVARANVLNALRLAVTGTNTIKLGNFITIAQGADGTALASSLNLLQLVTGSAAVANGTNLVSVPNVTITVPGVLTTGVSLKVIEGPKFYFGPVGGSVSTSQVELTITPSLNLDISVLGLAGVKVTGSFPVRASGAGAVGTLTAATCAGPGAGITVNVDPTAFAGSIAATLTVSANVILLGNIPILSIPTTNVLPSTDGGATNLTFAYPAQFPPPNGTTTTKHAGSQPIGLQALTNINVGTPVVLNAIALPLVGTIVTAVLAVVKPVLGLLDNAILTPLLTALGVDVGSADVTALAVDCTSPKLVG